MKTEVRWLMALAVAVPLTAGHAVYAADPVPTTITIPDMECGGCAKKVAAKLVEVPGVAKAEPDVEKRTVRVMPRANAVLSPRALWEAVEKASKKPMRLEGPTGTFTSKSNQ